MAEPVCEIEGVQVVLLGSFNPRIFHPSWFAHHELLRQEEAEQVQDLVCVRELATFTADWLTLQVTGERFQASTADASHFEVLRDFVFATFSILEHTPLEKMGINRDMHYKFPTEDEYVEIGHLLVPKSHWTGVLDDPRTLSVTVSGAQKRGETTTPTRVKVEPSARIQYGVYVSTNEHYEASGPDASKVLRNLLRDNWGTAQNAAKRIAEHLLVRK